MLNPREIKLKILVCEADVRVLKRLESWVKAMGEEVFTCSDAIIANDILEEETPDILLISQNINSMGVIEFIEIIKKKNPSQAIILMLNNDENSFIFKRSIDLQVDKYLNIPVDASLLFNAVEALAQEKIWYDKFRTQKRLLQDYKDAIDVSFSVSKHNKHGEIFYVNDSFCKITKLEYSEAMKGNINPLLNPHSNGKNIWDELNKNKIYRGRETFKFDDKQDHIVDVVAVAILDDNEEILEFLVFSNDVTEIVNAARKIKQQEIDKKFQKLQHAKELNKMKDTFLTIFSHELKTPLNSIINFSQYIKKHLQKEDFKKRDTLIEQISQINMSGWTMLDMITNLIDSIKLRNNELELLKSEFVLNDVVDEVLKKYSDDLKNIEVIKSFKQECLIDSDKKRVEQLLNNLISNSVKYCKNKISIIIKSNEDDFILEILDNGDGFSDTANVFELFEQSNENSMTRTAQGTGVGLFVVKKLCDLMKYDINIVNSKVLGGARIIIKGKRGIN